MISEINEELKNSLYTQIMDDINTSWKAKGIFCKMISEPNKIYTEYDFTTTIEKIDSVTTGLNSLIKNGYVVKTEKGILGYKIKGIKTETLKGNCPGCVYIIYDNLGNYKIGFALNFQKRIRSYNTSMPYRPKVIKLINCADMRKAEKFLHEKFKETRLNGEWFKLNEKELEYIVKLEDGFYND